MTRAVWALFALVPFLGTTAALAQDRGAEEVVMMVGESRPLNAAGVGSVVVGNPAVIDAVAPPGTDQVVISALGVGKSSLVLSRGARRQTFIIRVYSTPPAELVKQITHLLRGVAGVSVGQIGDRVVIDGRVYTGGDKARVDSVITLYKGEVESLVRFDEFSAARRTMFALELQVVELRTEDAHHLGIDLPNRFSVATAPELNYSHELDSGKGSAIITGVARTEPLVFGLNLMVREGLAEVRSRSTVVTEAGESASYDVGGAFFIKAVGINAGTIERIPFGTRFKILPTWDEEQRIVKLTVDASVTSLDFSQIIDDIPSLITNAIQTRVNLKEAETIILSGLDANNKGTTQTGLWPFAKIPILGYLFESEAKNDSSRKMLVFITPHLYKPGDELHRAKLEPMMDRQRAGAADDF